MRPSWSPSADFIFNTSYGGGNREIFNLFSLHLNILDEYFFEHVHKVIRQQIKVRESDELVRGELHGIFACSKGQNNWQSSFTPSKNSVFSRQ